MGRLLHKTDLGAYYLGDSVEVLGTELGERLRGQVQLILTSPPFPLNRKKSYGNRDGEEYKEWFTSLAPLFSELLTEDGSIVIEMGNSWMPGRPVQSLLHLESLICFVNNPEADLRLCQQFVCFNPSRLPSPAEWVTIRRIRLTDSYTHLWWMAKTDFPKADNRKVPRPYSDSMKALLKRRKYNAGKRPSQHGISENSFLTDHGGSIALNLFELEPMDEDREVRLPNAFSASHTISNDFFFRMCRERGITPHPARMPVGLASFFIEFLTDPGDLVLDPFAGSNTTGFAAEALRRRWTSIEIKEDYAEQSRIRLQDPVLKEPLATRAEEK
ncbi:Modification methylase PvuII [Rubrobacter xylanophilus DSM 9941]|uniref:DNA-methyltransferase n=1 Tax=Rubrobacter xylanophilus TaxID=49319 RepID=UPI001C64317A|nr:site-specific DNA-methyltransferase [Rubrobacter xylanophilus]QYJ15602.1 Modification methylase PvuII [Rubrobacter xylanophilus DSM 9941]